MKSKVFENSTVQSNITVSCSHSPIVCVAKYSCSGNITKKMPLMKTSNKELFDILEKFPTKNNNRSLLSNRNSVFIKQDFPTKNGLLREILDMDSSRKKQFQAKPRKTVTNNKNLYLVQNRKQIMNKNANAKLLNKKMSPTNSKITDADGNLSKVNNHKLQEMEMHCGELQKKIDICKSQLMELEKSMDDIVKAKENFIKDNKIKLKSNTNLTNSNYNVKGNSIDNVDELTDKTNATYNQSSDSTVVSSCVVNGFSYKLNSDSSHDLLSLSDNSCHNSTQLLQQTKHKSFFKRLWIHMKTNIRPPKSYFQRKTTGVITAPQNDPSLSHYYTATDHIT